MKSRKGMLVRDVVIGGILFTGIIAIFVILVANMAINYNNPNMVSQSFSQNYNKLQQLTQGANGLSVSQNSVENVSGMQLQGNFDVAFSSTWIVFNMIWGTVDTFTSAGASFISDFTFLDAGVIKLLIYILISLLITIVIFNIISSVTRGRL